MGVGTIPDVVDGTLVINGSDVPRLGSALSHWNTTSIVVTGATQAVDGSALVVTGRTNCFGLSDAAVTVTSTGTDAVIRLVLADGWRLGDWLPNPPFFRFGSVPLGSPAVSLLDRLELENPVLIFATSDGVDTPTSAPLLAGLNVVADFNPTGYLGLFENLLGAETFILSGTVVFPTAGAPPRSKLKPYSYPWSAEPTDLPPGIHLTVPLDFSLPLGKALKASDFKLRLYSPLDRTSFAADTSYAPILAVEGLLTVPSADNLRLLVTAIGLDVPEQLSMYGQAMDAHELSLGHLIDLVGSTDLSSSLPSDLQSNLRAMENLSLESVGIRLTPSPGGTGVTIGSVGLTIGIPGLSTNVGSILTINGLSAGFLVSDPFSSSPGLEVMVEGTGTVPELTASFDVMVEVSKDGSGATRLNAFCSVAGLTLPLSQLLDYVGLPAPSSADLEIDAMELSTDSQGNVFFLAEMADEHPWSINIGPAKLSTTGLFLQVIRPTGGVASGTFSGTFSVGALQFEFGYTSPGNLNIDAGLPPTSLSQLIAVLTDAHSPLPTGFDFIFQDSKVILQGTAGPQGSQTWELQLATFVDGVGSTAMVVKETGGSWGFVLGMALDVPKISALPGLHGLAALEKLVTLESAVVAVSTFQDSGFRFPALSPPGTSNGSSAPTAFSLPAGSGVSAGFQVSGKLQFGTASQAQQMLHKLLSLRPSMEFELTVTANPIAGSSLSVQVDHVLGGIPFSGSLGIKFVDGEPAFALAGKFSPTIDGQTILFNGQAAFLPDGLLISGGYDGSLIFDRFRISNVGFVLGCDWEGVPSVGVAGSITIGSFQASLAVMFDSTSGDCALAGSIIDISLEDVVKAFAPELKSPILDSLAHINLRWSSTFNLPDTTLVQQLGRRNYAAVAAAFAAQGTTLPSTSQNVLMVTGTPGKTWFITDSSGEKVIHYRLTDIAGQGIQVLVEPQFQFAMAPTSIGATTIKPGIFLSGRLVFFGLTCTAVVEVSWSRGVLVDTSLAPVSIGKPPWFSLTGSSGSGGAAVSICSYDRPGSPAHCFIDGKVTLFGLTSQGTISITPSGANFEIKTSLPPIVTQSNLSGLFLGTMNLTVSGHLALDVGAVSLGQLGTITLDVLTADFDVSVKNGTARALLTATAAFQNVTYVLATIDLIAEGWNHLNQIPGEISAEVKKVVIADLLNGAGSAEKWLAGVASGTYRDVADTGLALDQQFHLDAGQAATLLRDTGQSALDVLEKLKSAYSLNLDSAAAVLSAAEFPVASAGPALQQVFGGSSGEMASALKQANYAVADVSTFVQTAYRLSDNELQSALKIAGYAADDVQNLFKKVGRAFDPRSWFGRG